MELKEYQKRAMETCMESSNNFAYMFLNLVGEVGELSSKIAKGIRKNEMDIHRGHLLKDDYNEEKNTELKYELGDILWQLSGLCSVFDYSLEDIAYMNLEKLASRQERNVISGDGDNR